MSAIPKAAIPPLVNDARYPSDEISACPYPFYKQIRESAPVHRLPDSDVYLVSRYDDVLNILSDRQRFSSQRPWLKNVSHEAQAILDSGWPSTTMIAGEDPPLHTQHKKLAMPGVSRKRLVSLKETIQKLANELIDGFADAGRADFVTQYAELLPRRVIGNILQVPRQEDDIFRRWTNDTMSMLAGGLSYEREIECARSTLEFQRYVFERVQERRVQLDNTLISDLIRAQDDEGQGITDGEIINICLVILRAGVETTVQLLGSLMNELLRKPEQMAELRRDPALIPNAVEEALRFQSPLQYTTRLTKAEVEIGGMTVPANAQLLLILGAANRDEKIFAEADKFDMTRQWGKTHLGFGYGIHSCLGAQIARDEAAVTMDLMLSRFKSIRLADPDAPLSYHTAPPNVYGIKHLPITFE
jgi:cytochrome P450